MNLTYGFQLQGQHQEQSVGLYAIGHETQTEISYRWDGKHRSDRHCFVFQYTLSGSGAIKIADQIYHLTKNQAFWIEVPSDHCYYLPEDSNHWEFLYITLFGNTVHQIYQQLTQTHGHILTYAEQSPVIQLIQSILNEVNQNKITNSYQASARSYQFLMTLLENSSEEQSTNKEIPSSINHVLKFINDHFNQDISLDDCVKQSKLSKYYFTRQFSRYVGMTPIQYISNIRIQKAIELLLNDSDSIEDVAKIVGFQNGNYFAKVFKKHTGKSPRSYRNARSSMPVDHWFIN